MASSCPSGDSAIVVTSVVALIIPNNRPFDSSHARAVLSPPLINRWLAVNISSLIELEWLVIFGKNRLSVGPQSLIAYSGYRLPETSVWLSGENASVMTAPV